MVKRMVLLWVVLIGTALAGNAQEAAVNAVVPPEGGRETAEEWAVPPSARAIIKGVEAESAVTGAVDFIETGGGLQMVARLSNILPEGKRGIYIHQGESCEEAGNKIGKHFDPVGTPHGFLPRDGKGSAHAGDMGNIEINAEGKGTLVLFLPGLSLTQGYTNVIGKVVAVHAKEDDFSQPDGQSGAPIACGKIVLNK